MNPKVGDILLVHTPNNLLCWLIRKITQSHWNHVAWYVGDGKLIEVQTNGGVKYTPLSFYKFGNSNLCKWKRFEVNMISDEDLKSAIDIACDVQGAEYDWRLILSLVWLYVTASRKRKEARDWNCSWICSELISMPLWKVCKFQFRDSVPPENTVPADIALSCKLYNII